MRARMAMARADRAPAYEVVLRDKPDAMLDVSPKGTVPVLVLPNGEVIDESLDVMLWALSQMTLDGSLIATTVSLGLSATTMSSKAGSISTSTPTVTPSRPNSGIGSKGSSLFRRWSRSSRLRLAGRKLLPALRCGGVSICPAIRGCRSQMVARCSVPKYPCLARSLAGRSSITSVMRKYPQWHPGDQEPLFPDVA